MVFDHLLELACRLGRVDGHHLTTPVERFFGGCPRRDSHLPIIVWLIIHARHRGKPYSFSSVPLLVQIPSIFGFRWLRARIVQVIPLKKLLMLPRRIRRRDRMHTRLLLDELFHTAPRE